MGLFIFIYVLSLLRKRIHMFNKETAYATAIRALV
jgi:hypothetical protein